ncbi:MAG TPA: methyltransferase domain-containing protein [Thermoleophilaceae bacterium]|jgi:SAM-dependent methyltransferase|nr:methyltransferase domain-containing protein [Thermoleophilaceae bacterium]
MSAQTHDPVRWFTEHYEQAAGRILEFLGGDGISLEGKQVADVGCGDGIIDLGLALKGRPQQLIGYDLMEVDTLALLRGARAAGVADELPASLAFERSGPVSIPAADGRFDFVISWSVFEHVDDPVALLGEIRRVIQPDGCFFLQLWPFFNSEHGGHLWPHYDGPYPHHLRSDEQILDDVRGRQATDPRRSAEDEYRSLNRITLDDLQRALLVNRFAVVKFGLMANAVHVPRELRHRPLSELGIGGVELLAKPV